MPRFAAPLALAALLLPASAAQAAPPPSFYNPPSPLPGAKHGDVIRSRTLIGSIALKAAKANKLVLYRSVGLANKNVAVSGLVALPKGKAPKSGWPVITWAHGTTGMADQCAPTIAGQGDPALLNTWVKKGYAVVATDYDGLGTPGVHPYLNGNSEGHSILDVVRAARKLYPALGKRVVISGHSQGGQAALWAASLA